MGDLDEYTLNIYTDGSGKWHPMRGGVGVVFVFPEICKRDLILKELQRYSGANIAQMELQACLVGLKEILKFNDLEGVQAITFWVDRQEIPDNYTKAIYVWPNSKPPWYRSNGAPVMNAQLWKDLVREMNKVYNNFHIRVTFKWIKGHDGHEFNSIANRLAKSSADKPVQKPIMKISEVNVRKKLFDNKVKRGSVKMNGQKIIIRITTGELLPQKIWKYQYEVLSEKSQFYKLSDIIYFSENLRAGHVFEITCNKNQNFPQISKIIRELDKELYKK
ncbi:MAG: RNase H family protein [Patescibacteria group bacterium]